MLCREKAIGMTFNCEAHLFNFTLNLKFKKLHSLCLNRIKTGNLKNKCGIISSNDEVEVEVEIKWNRT